MNSADFDTVVSREGTGSMKWDRYKGRDILPFWVADMDFAVAEPIQRALQARMTHPMHGYGVAPASLAIAIADYLESEYRWQIDTDWLVYLPGVVNGLAASCRAYCDNGDEIMINPPIYHHFFAAHVAERHKLVQVPLHRSGQRWTYDFNAMEAACTEHSRLLMMCSPHNPTGTVFTQAELQRVAKLCAKHGMLMISDEIHCGLVIDRSAKHIPTAVACPEHADRVVTLMSSSKTWNLAGLNCSFAIISDQKLRDTFKASCASIVAHPVPLSYIATEAAYVDGEAWRQQLLDYLAANYSYLQTALSAVPELQLEPMQATYLAWIDASQLNVENVQTFFEDHGVGLSSGEQFGQPHYVRLNFACPRVTLEEGVRRMLAAVNSLA